MKRSTAFLLGCGLALGALGSCGNDDNAGNGTGVEDYCNPLGSNHCMTPWPSSAFEIEDSTSPTGYRLDIPEGTLPTSADNFPIDPAPYNTHDGFSAAAPIIMAFPEGISAANLVDHESYPISITDDSPTVIIDMSTNERVVHFAELDAPSEDQPDRQALYLRPSKKLEGGRRYAVVLRKSLRAKDGGDLTVPPGFQAILDGKTTTHPLLERMRPRYEAIWTSVEAAGIAKSDVLMTWDFTTVSDDSMRIDMITARDRGLPMIGEAGANITLTIDTDVPVDDGSIIARRIEGEYDAPLFLTQNGGFAPRTIVNRDSDGLPEPVGMYKSPFTAIVPACALTSPTPVPMMIYGHGLLGNSDQAASGAIRDTAAALCYVVVGTDMRGMSDRDLPAVARTLNNLNFADEFFEVQVQGIVNTIALAQAMRGPMAEQLFVNGANESIVDPTQIVYYGLSQGHIFGSTFLAYDPFVTRGVVGVGGANYSLMLERSTDWPTYKTIMIGAYPDPLDVALLIGLMQMRWDLSDPSGTVDDILTGKIPGTPPKQILLHMAIGDDEVPNISTEWQARTMGVSNVGPTVKELYGIPTTTEPIMGGSGLVIWDGGSPIPPLTNVPAPDTGAHGVTRKQPAAWRQMGTFYETGVIEHTCGTTACVCSPDVCE